MSDQGWPPRSGDGEDGGQTPGAWDQPSSGSGWPPQGWPPQDQPPQAGSGWPPQDQPPAGWGQPGPTAALHTEPYSPTRAISWGWNLFTRNASTFVLATVIVVVGAIAIGIAWGAVATALVGSPLSGIPGATLDLPFGQQIVAEERGFLAQAFVAGVHNLAGDVYRVVTTGLLARMAFVAAAGQKPELDTFFDATAMRTLLAGGVLLWLLSSVAALLLIGELAVLYLFWFFPFVAVDRPDLSTGDALRHSLTLSTSRIGGLLGQAALALLVFLLGVLALLVGVLAAIPIVLLASAYAVRTLQGQPIVPS